MISDLILGEGEPVPAIPKPSYLPTIRYGSQGDAVRYAQTVMKQRYGQNIVIDGIFGYQTEGAVKKLQSGNALPADGIVGSTTWQVINRLGAASGGGTRVNIKPYVTGMQVSLTMDEVSQITFEVTDPGLLLADKNYWNIRRPVTYLGMQFEISAYDIRQGNAGEIVRVEARNAACQKMKRNKGANLFTGGNATVYAATKAREVGLKFFGESTSEQATISQTSSTDSDESVWDVLKRLAGQYQFVRFETNNRLFFTSQKFLLGKYAVVDSYTTSGYFYTPIRWRTFPSPATTFKPEIPAPSTSPILRRGSVGTHVTYVQRVYNERAGFSLPLTGYFDGATELVTAYIQIQNKLSPTGVVDAATWAVIRYLGSGREVANKGYSIKALECPQCRKSDDDVNAAQISFQVDQGEGRAIRPGMTVRIMDIPDFIGDYIVTEVQWQEGTVGSVSVTARTPVEPEKPAVTSSGTGTGTTSPTEADLLERDLLSGGSTGPF